MQCWAGAEPVEIPPSIHEHCHSRGPNDTKLEKAIRMEMRSRRILDREMRMKERQKIAAIGGHCTPQFAL